MLGAVSLINAFLPSLRIAHGRVIQVSSWIASLPVPFSGPSAASMAALKALSAAYRAEVRPSGVDVVTVTTDLVRPIADAGQSPRTVPAIVNLTATQRDLHGKRMSAAAARIEELAISGADLVEVADRVVQIARAGSAASHEAVGRRAVEIAAAAQTKNDADLEAFRLSLVGLS